jgi:hypothetical protein
MSHKLTVTALSAICLAWAASPASADMAIIGQSGQGNLQGANSNQSGVNGTGGGGGDTSVLGDATPIVDQNSTNFSGDGEVLGTGDGALIGSGPNAGFTQSNENGTNSTQVAQNGDTGNGLSPAAPHVVQNSANVSISALLIAVTGTTILVGNNAQAGSGGVNSSQSANNFPGGGETHALTQNSGNLLISTIILGD